MPNAPRSSRPVAFSAFIAFTLFSAVFAIAATPASPPAVAHAPVATSQPQRVAANYGKLPISFEANRGQSGQSVKFLARGRGYGLYLTGQEAVLALKSSQHEKTHAAGPQTAPTDMVRMQLRGANPLVQPIGVDKLPGSANYFIGKDPSAWRTNIPTYSSVQFTGVYPGVDLVYYGNQSRLEYDFRIAPQADPRVIRLHFAGAAKLSLTTEGDLAVSASHGGITFQKPEIYQEIDGQRQTVPGRFTLLADGSIGFKVGSYDHARPLIIDPVLVYSTYLGGSDTQFENGLAVDTSGDAYVVGSTGSSDFPVTSGAYQTIAANGGSFVTKFNPAGTALLYSTFFSGQVAAIAVDGTGNAYLTGTAYNNFPVTSGAFQVTNNDDRGSCFLTKLNSTGTALVYSTYLGGTGFDSPYGSEGDQGTAVAVDASGTAYVTGSTASSDFPVTQGVFQTIYLGFGAASGFATRFNVTGTALLYSTYLGGSGIYSHGPGFQGDTPNGIVLDGAGDAFITGRTYSLDFPTTPRVVEPADPAQPGSSSGFVSKLNPTASALVYSTYLGGSDFSNQYADDFAAAIAVDKLGNAYVTGTTDSDDFPVTTGAFQTTNHSAGGGQYGTAFVTKLNPSGSGLIYSTYLGGSIADQGAGIAVDSSGDAYIAGRSYSKDFPVTPDALQSTNKAYTNAFVAELDPAGSALLYSTYLGGTAKPNFGDSANSLTLDGAGAAYVAGTTYSKDFPVTPGAFQTTNQSSSSVFVAKLDLGSLSTTPAVPTFSPAPGKLFAPTMITLKDATPGTTIYYTFGYKPPYEGWMEYTGPFTVSGFTHIQTFALDGSAGSSNQSTIAAGDYTFVNQAPAPTISPAPGNYPSGQLVTISDSIPTATLRYTTDGSAPTTHSTWYHGPIVLTGSETIRAIAISTDDATSNVTSAAYTVH